MKVVEEASILRELLVSWVLSFTGGSKFVSPEAISKYHFEKIKTILSETKSSLLTVEDRKKPGAFCILRPLDWDSKVYKINMCSIDYFLSSKKKSQSLWNLRRKVLKEVLSKARDRGFKFISARVFAGDFEAVHMLEEAGFKLMDISVTFSANTDEIKWTPKREIQIRDHASGDLQSLRRIASESFVYNRFFNDPRLPQDKTKLLYAEWINNACRSNKNKILVAVSQTGRPVGFCICKIDDMAKRCFGFGVGQIDLIAVLPSFRGRSIGEQLLKAAFSWFKKRTKIVEIRTQMANISAVRNFNKAGFKDYCNGLTLPAGMVFHKWLD